MGVSVVIGNLIFEYLDVKNFDVVLVGNKQAILRVYSVTYNRLHLSANRLEKKYISRHTHLLTIIMSLGTVEAFLVSGDTLCWDDVSWKSS